MMMAVLWYQSPKNLSSSLPSSRVWWSRRDPSSSLSPGLPNRGAHPTFANSFSASVACPLASSFSLIEEALIAPDLLGGGRS